MLALLVSAGSLALGAPALRAKADESENPPVAGQPSGFTGAIGTYTISAAATPTDVRAEDPILFTITIVGTVPVNHPLRWPDLKQRPAFAQRFHIEDLDAQVTPTAAVFRYRLRPLRADVREIPPLRFDYYKPGVMPPEKGYRATYARAIPLTVRPRTVVEPSAVERPVEPPPATTYHLMESTDAVLRHDHPFAFPSPAWVVVYLLAAPLLAAGWYLIVRRWSADAMQRRTSRAATKATRELEQAARLPLPEAAHRIGSILTAYLRERTGLAGAAPTPEEVRSHLAQGLPDSDLPARAAAFFKRWDAVRFAPPVPDSRPPLAAEAAAIIHALEAQPWDATS